jgi:CDP-6-deoxy-D-xylo-4-hexulose-3-dehydrase
MIKKIFKFPLMRNNISRDDLDKLISHLQKPNPQLTQGKNVHKFEILWSKWLDVKYSVFVNSGSSANLLSLTLLKLKFPSGGEVIVPPLTWVSDIASVLQTGFKPVFCDINFNNLGISENEILKKITKKTRAIFLSHIQGFNALTDKILEIIKKKKNSPN